MKIEEARQIYNVQIKEYQAQKLALSKQKKDLEKRMSFLPNGSELYANEAATLELTYKAVSDKQQEYQDYMSQLLEQWSAKANMISGQQQADAMAEYAVDMGKLMEVARRLMKGDVVPASDEKKLMEYSMDMYQAAKNMGMLMRNEKREEHDSLWGDEEEKEYADPIEEANNTEAFGPGPEVVDVADTMAAAVAE